MPVYVDNAFIPATVGRITSRWCHMTADTLDELHSMADRIGMKRSWFQDKTIPHYDVTESKRKLAVSRGAVEVSALAEARRRVRGKKA